jgi:hypothetical protein
MPPIASKFIKSEHSIIKQISPFAGVLRPFVAIILHHIETSAFGVEAQEPIACPSTVLV